MAIIKMNKLHEDSTTLWVDELRMTEGASFTVKDKEGFTILEVDSDGNLKIKGDVRRV